MAGLLDPRRNWRRGLAANDGVGASLEPGELLCFEALFDEFASSQAQCPAVVVEMPSAAPDNALLDVVLVGTTPTTLAVSRRRATNCACPRSDGCPIV
jgi:hypothetical protein